MNLGSDHARPPRREPGTTRSATVMATRSRSCCSYLTWAPDGDAGFCSSAASFGVELVFLALVDGVGAITSAVGGGVTEAECDDDDGNDPQGVNGEAEQPENQRGAQDHQHHLAEARPLAEQERDPLGQPAPFGCLAGAACRLGGRCWECSLR